MVFPNAEVNYLAVLIAAIVSFVIGSLWFGALFGRVWMREMKVSEKDIEKSKKKSMRKLYLINFIGSLVMIFILGVFISYMGITRMYDGILIGFLTWLGFFAATTLLGSVLWEGKSWKLYFINAAYWLVNLLIIGGILSAWR